MHYKPSLLVAEDETLIAMYIQGILEENGYSVRVCQNGQIAMEALLVDHFDVLITDIAMPRMDGHELIARIREEGCDVPIIVLSGHFRNPDAIEEKDVTVLSKPVEPVHLIQTVESLMQDTQRLACQG